MRYSVSCLSADANVIWLQSELLLEYRWERQRKNGFHCMRQNDEKECRMKRWSLHYTCEITKSNQSVHLFTRFHESTETTEKRITWKLLMETRKRRPPFDMSHHSILIGDNYILYIQLLRSLYSHCDCLLHLIQATASIFSHRDLYNYMLYFFHLIRMFRLF